MMGIFDNVFLCKIKSAISSIQCLLWNISYATCICSGWMVIENETIHRKLKIFFAFYVGVFWFCHADSLE